MRKLVLFDIDGTLVLTGGAGVRAMNRALQEELGDGDGLRGIPVAGRTDWAILVDAAQRYGRELDAVLLERLRQRYVVSLADEIEHPGQGRKDVMPGVREILADLSARSDILVGLLTGNFREGARVKLGHFGLWQYFSFGAFGDDAADRNSLVPVAVQRSRAFGFTSDGGDVLVVGDTQADIQCATAGGAVPIGVATGSVGIDALRAAGATHLFEDLSDTAAFLRLLE